MGVWEDIMRICWKWLRNRRISQENRGKIEINNSISLLFEVFLIIEQKKITSCNQQSFF